MQLAATLIYFLFYMLVPHFRTIHYFRVMEADGNIRRIYIQDPEEISEENRQYIHCLSTFVLLGIFLFPRCYPYQSS